MKAEHRKELVTNSLAQTLGQTIQGLKEGPSSRTVLVVVLIGLALLLFFTWRYFAQSSQAADSELWLRWDSLVTPTQVTGMLDDRAVADTPQGRLARFLAARSALQEGLRDLGRPASKAQDNLKKAADLYAKLAAETSRSPLLHQEALLCGAQAHEALGDYGQAKGLYEQLAKQYPDTPRGKDAQQQVERLGNKANEDDLNDLKNRLLTSSNALK
jgi:hypothetical protein